MFGIGKIKIAIEKAELDNLKKSVKDMGEEIKGLRAEKRKLFDELEELKVKKVMEEREIKHLVKLKEEKLEIDNQKKVLELDKQYSDKTMALQKEYHEKQLSDIGLARKEMKEVYEKIMERLPNINTQLEIKRR
jgi:chromosome segregation ATPase